MEDKYNVIIGMDKSTKKKMPHLRNYNNKMSRVRENYCNIKEV